jgi:hypothetical protein
MTAPLDVEQACCAHMQIEWRTEIVEDGGTNVRGEPCAATRGWWECTSGCGTTFGPRHLPPSEVDAIEKLVPSDAPIRTGEATKCPQHFYEIGGPCTCTPSKVETDAQHSFGDGECAWLVYFEDQDHRPEVFTGRGGEMGAKARYLDARQAWSCHLFHSVAWNISPELEPTFKHRHLQAPAPETDAEKARREAHMKLDRYFAATTPKESLRLWREVWESVEHAQFLEGQIDAARQSASGEKVNG